MSLNVKIGLDCPLCRILHYSNWFSTPSLLPHLPKSFYNSSRVVLIFTPLSLHHHETLLPCCALPFPNNLWLCWTPFWTRTGTYKKDCSRSLTQPKYSTFAIYNWIMEQRVWRDSEGTVSKAESNREVKDKAPSLTFGKRAHTTFFLHWSSLFPDYHNDQLWFPVGIGSSIAFKGSSFTSWGIWNEHT